MAIDLKIQADYRELIDGTKKIADSLEETKSESDDLNKSVQKTFDEGVKSVKEINSEISKSIKVTSGLSKEVDKLKKSFVENSKASEKGFDDKPIEKSTKAVKNQRGEIEKIRRSIKALELLRERSNDTDRISSYNDQLKEQKDKLNEVLGLSKKVKEEQKDTGGGGGFFSNLNERVSKASGGLVNFGTIGAAGILGIGKAVFDVNAEFDKLRGTIQQSTELTGGALDRVTAKVSGLSDTFDKENNEIINAAKTVSKEFGTSYDESLKLIEDGFLAGSDANDDFLDKLLEYPAQFANAGGSADAFFKVINQEVKEGVYSDKGIDAVKEFNLRIREQTPATKDAVKALLGFEEGQKLLDGVRSGAISSVDAIAQISGELENVDTVTQQTAIADIFGGAGEDAGVRFLSTLKDINDENGVFIDDTNGLVQSQKANLEANERLAATQNELSKAIGDSSGVGRVWTEIMNGFYTIMLGLAEAVNTLSEAWESLFGDGDDRIQRELKRAELLAKNLDVTKENVQVITQARLAIDKFGESQKKEIQVLSQGLAALQSDNVERSKKEKIIKSLNDQYPEILKNYDLENASQEDYAKIQYEIRRAIIEKAITQKRTFIEEQIQARVRARLAEIELINDRKKKLQAIENLRAVEQNVREELQLKEDAIRKQLGLQDELNEAESPEEEQSEVRTVNQVGGAGSAEEDPRIQIQKDFDALLKKLIQQGDQARLTDQTVSDEERLKRQRDANLKELENLKSLIEEKNKLLNGVDATLSTEAVEAFNEAQQAIQVDFENKVSAIRDAARAKELQSLRNQNSLELSILEEKQSAELAEIEKLERERGETEGDFANRRGKLEIEILRFYAEQKKLLILEDADLKKEALQDELEDISNKEGQAFENRKKEIGKEIELIDLKTQAQLDGLEVYDLEEEKVNALSEAFNRLKSQIAGSLGISAEELDAAIGAIQQVGSQIFQTIQEINSEQVEANAEVVSNIQERISATEDAIKEEEELEKEGVVSNVNAKKAELEELRVIEEEALKEQEELVRTQERLNTIQQISSLTSASASIFNSVANIPIIGVPLAISLIGAMFGAFAVSKSKAKQATKLAKGGLLEGPSHENGGIPIKIGSTTPYEGEGGEFVINKMTTSENKEFIEKLNDGAFAGLDLMQMIRLNNLSLEPEINFDSKDRIEKVVKIEQQQKYNSIGEAMASKQQTELLKLIMHNTAEGSKGANTNVNYYTNSSGKTVKSVSTPKGTVKTIVND